LYGPFGAMLNAPLVGQRLQELGAAIRFETDLTPRCREIAILQVAQALGSEFEWWAHERVGRASGLDVDELTALSVGSFVSSDPVETAVATFCDNLLHSSAVTDDEFAAASQILTARQLTELTVLVGYYRLLAQLLTVFAIGAPNGDRDSRGAHGHGH
jgi:4-carboxymuconolactone decarboxylase